jgi:microcystin-dependent protein
MDNKENIVEAMNSFLSEIINVGTIIPFAGNVIPSGYLHCDGTVYKSSDYPFLAELLNPGGDTFTVPNLKSRVCYGSIDDTTLLLTGGYDEVALDTSHLPSHGHDVTSENGHYHYGTTGSAKADYKYNNNSSIVLKDGSRYVYGSQPCSHSHTVEFSNTSHTHTCHYAGYGYGRGMGSVTTDTGTINYANCLSQQNGGKGKLHQNWQRTTYMCYLIKY